MESYMIETDNDPIEGFQGDRLHIYVPSGQKHNVAFTAAPLAYNELRPEQSK